jgi:hypothetical protein
MSSDTLIPPLTLERNISLAPYEPMLRATFQVLAIIFVDPSAKMLDMVCSTQTHHFHNHADYHCEVYRYLNGFPFTANPPFLTKVETKYSVDSVPFWLASQSVCAWAQYWKW